MQLNIKIAQGIEFEDSNFTFIPIFLIVTGIFVMIIAFLGCAGTVMESKCMIKTYGSLLLIIFLLMVVMTILMIVIKSDKKVNIKNSYTCFCSVGVSTGCVSEENPFYVSVVSNANFSSIERVRAPIFEYFRARTSLSIRYSNIFEHFH